MAQCRLCILNVAILIPWTNSSQHAKDGCRLKYLFSFSCFYWVLAGNSFNENIYLIFPGKQDLTCLFQFQEKWIHFQRRQKHQKGFFSLINRDLVWKDRLCSFPSLSELTTIHKCFVVQNRNPQQLSPFIKQKGWISTKRTNTP